MQQRSRRIRRLLHLLGSLKGRHGCFELPHPVQGKPQKRVAEHLDLCRHARVAHIGDTLFRKAEGRGEIAASAIDFTECEGGAGGEGPVGVLVSQRQRVLQWFFRFKHPAQGTEALAHGMEEKEMIVSLQARPYRGPRDVEETRQGSKIRPKSSEVLEAELLLSTADAVLKNVQRLVTSPCQIAMVTAYSGASASRCQDIPRDHAAG